MAWVAIDGLKGLDQRDAPRRLTEAEIEDIVSVIPPPRTPDEATAAIVRESMMRGSRRVMSQVEITPKAISELKVRIVNAHWQSQVVPGSSVGLSAAEAIGASATQTALNTFHASGSAKSASSGILAMSNYIYATAQPRGTITTVHWRDHHQTPRELLENHMPEIVTCTLRDLIADVDLYRMTEPMIVNGTYSDELQENFPWAPAAILFQEKSVVNPDATAFCFTALILRVDQKKMIKHQVTMREFCRSLESERPVNSVVTIYSPLEQGTVLLLPRLPLTEPNFYAELDFYHTVVIPELSSVRVKGLANMTDFRVINRMTVGAVHNERDLMDGWWELSVDPIVTRREGIAVADLEVLFKHLRLPTRAQAETLLVQAGSSPLALLAVETKIAKEAYEAELNRLANEIAGYDVGSLEYNRKKREFGRVPYPKILRDAQYSYAEVSGDNLKSVFRLPGIDRNRTFTDNIHTISQVLGIEAMCTAYPKGLHRTITEAGNSVHGANLLTVTDCIASMGKASGVRFTGLVARQPQGHLSNATMQKAIDVFTKAAAFGGVESVRNASAAVTLGVKITNGSGLNTVAQFFGDKVFVDDAVFESFKNDPQLEEKRLRAQQWIGTTNVQYAAPTRARNRGDVLDNLMTMQGVVLRGEDALPPEKISEGLIFPLSHEPVPFGAFENILQTFLDAGKQGRVVEEEQFNYRVFLNYAEQPVVERGYTEEDRRRLIAHLLTQ